MPVKIRLQRRGRRKLPHYNIVVADNMKPRDGRSIEKLGFYNPNTQPATIELNNDKALKWLQNGAIPTPTVDRILSVKGVKYRKHLLRGVKKGVISQEEADEQYAQWLEESSRKIQEKIDKVKEQADQEAKKRLEHEMEINRQRAEQLHAQQAEEEEVQADDGEETSSSEGDAEASGEETAAQEGEANEESGDAEAENKQEEATDSEEEASDSEKSS